MHNSAPVEESALVFSCQGSRLVGILHNPGNAADFAMVVVVGGPQTRVGSHRQFVQLARMLADNGIPVLRFDYRGMGDSDGEQRNFEQINDDICAAIDTLQAKSGVDRIVLWGLCDAASAIATYANTDERICGIALLNPWVRTEQGVARAYLRMHYVKRLFSGEFWAKLSRGELNVIESVKSLADTTKRALHNNVQTVPQLPDRVMASIERFSGSILLVLSGNDLTAQEFHSTVEGLPLWQKLCSQGRIVRRELEDADHTFSRREWSRQVERWTFEWINTL